MSLAKVIPTAVELLDYAAFGKVEQTIQPHQRGRVKFLATYWFARFHDPNHIGEVSSGAIVKIIGREGNTLLITLVEKQKTD